MINNTLLMTNIVLVNFLITKMILIMIKKGVEIEKEVEKVRRVEILINQMGGKDIEKEKEVEKRIEDEIKVEEEVEINVQIEIEVKIGKGVKKNRCIKILIMKKRVN